ncbi:MAG TPA: VOC family protein [Candidatus Cybelea sp.]|nr:VOC family protein [Candidatus Cybelea sp.]
MPVRSLLSYALEVPDLEAGRRFYTTFGLLDQPRGNSLAFRCLGRDQDQVHLLEGSRKKLSHLRFGASEADIKDIRARLAERGLREIDPPSAEFAGGIWFRDPDGNAVNVRPEAAKPARSGPLAHFNSPGHYERVGAPGCPPKPKGPVRPYRLGHVLLFTPRLDGMIGFYSDVLGMKLSDRCGPIIAFMHVAGGGDHHVVALLSDERSGFHHASFEVGSIDEIGLGAVNVLSAGYRDGWGFGRHVIGSNFFHYVRDPWGSLAEYFWDIDQIPADGSWRPTDYPNEDALYRWGPAAPADFGVNFEARG